MATHKVTVIGGGLAGCEATWQLLQAGIAVRLLEMKPLRRTPAQVTNNLAELVCSNSLRSQNTANAVGMLKEEMRRLDSLIVSSAEIARVPAGDALAVDREVFAATILKALKNHPLLEIVPGVVEQLPSQGDCIVATGPLTESALAQDIAKRTGQERLYFYDAIAPIVTGESIDRSIAFAASRYGKGEGNDYLNCPMNKDEYDAFLDALLSAEYMPLHDFEEPKYFQGCLPVEVVAASGRDSLRYGCMKPVGLDDPRTGRWPYAVVQLRQEDKDGQAWNLVGFQTKLKYPEQKRVFAMIPGLAQAEFVRLGAIHRNTYLDSPALLDERMRLKAQPNIRFAGQITGVEGYVESAAHGLLTARMLASELLGRPVAAPPAETALGGLFAHVCGHHRLPGRPHEPQNVNWSMVPPLSERARKADNKRLRAERAVSYFTRWGEEQGLNLLPPRAPVQQKQEVAQA